jgi:hypothetical protein
MSASLYYCPEYEFYNFSYGEHVENCKTMGELKEGDLLYYQHETYIGKCYLRYYPLHTRKVDNNGIIKNFKIIVTYVFTDDNGKETRYKRDINFGDINYEEFKNSSLVILPVRTTGRPDYNHNSILEWHREIYSPDINLLKKLLEEKGKLKLNELQEEIEKFKNDLNTAIEEYKKL